MAKPIVNPGAPTTIQPVPSAGTPPPDAGKGLNTGDNGFPINDKDLTGKPGPQQYTYDTGANGQGGSQGNYEQGVDVSAAYQNTDGTPKDLKPATLMTLSKYLSKVTLGQQGASTHPNVYPVGDVPVQSSISEKGYPAALEIQPVNPNNFAGTAESQIDYPTQQYPAISTQIKKGLSTANAVDGNNLLPGVTGTSTSVASNPGNLTGDAPKVVQTSIPGRTDTSAKIVGPYTSAVLANNRFTDASSAFVPQGTNPSDPGPGFDPSLTQQSKLGEWDPGAPTVSVGRLATIGTLLGLRATTTLGATSAGADPNSGGEQAAALLPGLAQLGAATIDQHVLQAADILTSLTNDEVPSSNILSIGTQSWGQLNDANDPYSGIDALGMLTLSIALAAAVELIIDGLSIIMGFITPQLAVPQVDAFGRAAIGQYWASGKQQPPSGPLGAITALASLNFAALLGINPTNFPLSSAVSSGLAAFFGLPQPSPGGISISIGLPGGSSSNADSPGYLVVVARSIIRGFIIIGQSLSKIGGNPMNVINAILSMIETIRNSKVVAAINVFAKLGDQLLIFPAEFQDTTATGFGNKYSEMDSIPDSMSNAMSQNRLNGSLKLAWASNRSRANLLIPNSILSAMTSINNMGQFNVADIGVQNDPHSLIQPTVTNTDSAGRIDSVTAQMFEQTLDAEYVPFYFHDLRTNEMVAFHAFLSSLSEDFNAAYEKVDGFGRVEPVRIYKSTERRINMSFFIAATSVNDFDEMWVKINKLVTLMYPQYTQGVQQSDQSGKYVFTQPFSQLIGASPMIRLRLGNLLHTNYSQFNLARLFGLGNSNMSVNGQTFTDAGNFDQSTLAKLPPLILKALANPNSEEYFVAPGSYNFAPPSSGGGLSLPTPPIPGVGSSSQGPKFAPMFKPQLAAIHNLFTVQAKSLNPTATPTWGNSPPPDPGMLVCQVQVNTDPDFQLAFSQAIGPATSAFSNTNNIVRQVIGGTYLIPSKALTPTNTQKAKFLAQIAPASSATSFAQELTTFLSPTGTSPNAVAKSFSDTGGNGLAGFIESMAFDWYDKVTWELGTNRVAPKLCKVTLTFSPIHDISPGIDHLGFNRAPVYPVGPMAQLPTSNS